MPSSFQPACVAGGCDCEQARILCANGCLVAILLRVADPDLPRLLLEDVDYAPDPYACADESDALVIVTEWDAFRALDLDRVRTFLKSLVIIDLRNIYRPDDTTRRGFRYVDVGQPQDARVDSASEIIPLAKVA